MLLSSVVLVIDYFFFNPFVQFSSKGDTGAFGSTLKVMSYNVRLFNAYQESSKVNVGETISEIIGETSPDVVCVQEYYRRELSDPPILLH